MSTISKTNGRPDYVARSNSNPNKIQTMNYRNSVTNTQHTNGSNGETYSYEDKSQRNCNSPKIITECHGLSQHNTSPRESYPYKNNNSRPKQYHNKNYSEKNVNFYSQRSATPEDVIPEIDILRQFVKEQTDRFKMELSRHESQKSNSPSPGRNYYNDQTNYKYNKSYGSLGRSTNGFPVSHSLGSIANSNTSVAPVTALTISPSCSDNTGRNQDARLISQHNSFTIIKNNNGYNNYNKYPTSVQNSGKPSPGLTRNLSHEESYSKSPNIIKTRNDSPSNNQNVDKSVTNKAQFPSPTASSSLGGRQDSKKAYFKSGKSFPYTTGSNSGMHQLNQNNSAINEDRMNDQQSNTINPVINSGNRNYVGSSKTTSNRRVYSNQTRIDSGSTADMDPPAVFRTIVSVDTGVRRRSLASHHGNNVDSQDSIGDSHPIEQFYTPDPSASPCSTTRSSPESSNAVAPISHGRLH